MLYESKQSYILVVVPGYTRIMKIDWNTV